MNTQGIAGPHLTAEYHEKAMREAETTLRLDTLEVVERRAIVKGDLALVSQRIRFTRNSGEEVRSVVTVLFAKQRGQWFFCADLGQEIDMGTDPGVWR